MPARTVDSKFRDMAEIVAVLAEAMPTVPPQMVAARALQFCKAARVIERNAVNQCNGVDSPRTEARALKAANAVATLASECGFTPRLGGDPRGYTLKLILPTGRYNTWGGVEDGWGVPSNY